MVYHNGMKNLLIAAIAVALLSGCTDQSVVESNYAAEHLDGSLVRDKDGCVYTVTRYGQNAAVFLRHMPELSAETCTFTAYDAS